MAPKLGRRGVLMTATARKPRAAWREALVADESDCELSDDEEAKKSRLEWDSISREVREEKRKHFAEKEFAQGNRDGVTQYDDIAEVPSPSHDENRSGDKSDNEAVQGSQNLDADKDATSICPDQVSAVIAKMDEAEEIPANCPDQVAAFPAKTDEAAGTPANCPDQVAAVTANVHEAGQVPENLKGEEEGPKRRKRGGRKINKRKRDDDAGERNEKRRKTEEEEEEEAKKWIRVRLEGESKPKRIKTARVVYYYDHDGKATDSTPREENETLPAAKDESRTSEAPKENLRDARRAFLWDADDSDE